MGKRRKPLHRMIGGVLGNRLTGYWPLVTWAFIIPLVSPVLLASAVLTTKRVPSKEFFIWFVVIGCWGTLQLLYDYWFAGWAYLWLLHGRRIEVLCQRIQTTFIIWNGQRQAAWLVRKIRVKAAYLQGLSIAWQRGARNRSRSLSALLAMFAYGMLPKFPKFHVAASSRAERWERRFLFLTAGNFLRVAIEVSALVYVKTLFRKMWWVPVVGMALYFLWQYCRRRTRRLRQTTVIA